MNGGAFVIGTMTLVVLVGLLAALVTWAFHPAPVPRCTANCPPPQAPHALLGDASRLPEQSTFTSSQFGYKVDYQSPWKVRDSNGAGATFDARDGIFLIQGAQTSDSAIQLIQSDISRFQGSSLPDLAAVGPLHGAHIGTQEGVGELFGGTYFPQNGGGRSIPIRIGIIVAKRGNLTVLATAFTAYDPQHDVMFADDIDYAMTEFRWPGEP